MSERLIKIVKGHDACVNHEGFDDQIYRVRVQELHEVEYEYRGTYPGQNYSSGDMIWSDDQPEHVVVDIKVVINDG